MDRGRVGDEGDDAHLAAGNGAQDQNSASPRNRAPMHDENERPLIHRRRSACARSLTRRSRATSLRDKKPHCGEHHREHHHAGTREHRDVGRPLNGYKRGSGLEGLDQVEAKDFGSARFGHLHVDSVDGACNRRQREAGRSVGRQADRGNDGSIYLRCEVRIVKDRNGRRAVTA